jgi:hypothetical protein
MKITKGLAAMLAVVSLSGCFAHLAPQGDETHDIEFGQTVSGNFKPMSQARLDAHESIANAHTYRFRAEQGSWVTVTVRSAGPDITLWLNKGFKPFMGSVGSSAFAFAAWPDFDPTPDGHAELILPLSKNKTGEYAVEVRSRQPGGYTLTLTEGIAPTLDLWSVPTPLSAQQGEYPLPFRKDGTLAPWVGQVLANSAGAGGLASSVGEQTTKVLLGAAAGATARDVGKLIGSKVAVSAAGGWDAIRGGTDYAFASHVDLALYLHLMHSTDSRYVQVLQALEVLYPGFDNTLMYVSGRHFGRWRPVR